MRHDVTYGAFPSCTYQAFQLHVVVQFVSSFKACVRVAVFLYIIKIIPNNVERNIFTCLLYNIQFITLLVIFAVT